jgi:hypothetical protein
MERVGVGEGASYRGIGVMRYFPRIHFVEMLLREVLVTHEWMGLKERVDRNTYISYVVPVRRMSFCGLRSDVRDVVGGSLSLGKMCS